MAPMLEFQEKDTALHPISFISSTFLQARSSEGKKTCSASIEGVVREQDTARDLHSNGRK